MFPTRGTKFAKEIDALSVALIFSMFGATGSRRGRDVAPEELIPIVFETIIVTHCAYGAGS